MRRGAWTRMLGAATIAGLLALGGVSPSLAQPAVAVTPAERGAYMDRIDAEMGRWRMKMDGMSEKAKATDQATATAAEAELMAAWHRTEARVTTLKTATGAEWSEARSAYERSSEDLMRAWDRTRL